MSIPSNPKRKEEPTLYTDIKQLSSFFICGNCKDLVERRRNIGRWECKFAKVHPISGILFWVACDHGIKRMGKTVYINDKVKDNLPPIKAPYVVGIDRTNKGRLYKIQRTDKLRTNIISFDPLDT